MKFKKGDLVRQNLNSMFGKNLSHLVPKYQTMQGIVLGVKDIPEEWRPMEEEEQIVEVLWANGYPNLSSQYFDNDLILISRNEEVE